MRIKRKKAYAIRGAIHEIEGTMKCDRSQIAEMERDLIATACVALWEVDLKRVISCLSRLTKCSPERREAWGSVLGMTLEALKS